ncbi:MAG: hypothetical protein LIO40_04170, partial [Ruminococcus sp.]|nr:hypothetical protein [Ruminococcus sp.]
YIYNVCAIDSTSGASDIDLLEYKSYIYHMMLNSVDYFNNAQGEMVYAMNFDSPIEIEFQTDIDEQCSYECLTQNGEIVEINFVEDNVAYTVDAINCTYVSYSQGDVIEFSISDNDRFVMLDSGETLAVNRNDLTNLATAGKSCLFTPSYAMSYLSDFSSWNISGMENLCGRDCVIVDGTANGNPFTMWIDVNTGILMKYGDIEGYVQVDSIAIDENIEVNSFSFEMYTKAE